MALFDGTNAPTISVDFDTSNLGAFVLGVSYLDGTDVLGSGSATWSQVATTDVRKVSIRRGRTREDQAVQPGALTLTLDNRSGNYDPDNPASTYVWAGYSLLAAGLGVRVRATWSGTDYIIYRGYLEQIDVDMNLDPITVMQFTDGLAWIGRQTISAISSSYSGDTTSTRLGRILDAAGWSASMRSLTGSRQMQPTIFGDTALSLGDQVGRCEFGRFYCDRQGNITLLPWESTFTTPQRIAFSDTRATGTVEYDTIVTNPGAKYIVNSATINQSTGVSQTYTDTTSLGRFGAYSKAYDAPLLNNSDAATLAQIIVSRYSLPKTRVDRVEFDALGISVWSDLLQTDLGDNVTVQRTTVDSRTRTFTSLVESIEIDISPYNWRVGMDLSPAAGSAYFTLGSSLLNGADVLYY